MTVRVFGRAQEQLDLDEAEAAARWQRGEVAFDGEEVAVRNADGTLGHIPNDPERIRTALASGYTLANADEAHAARVRTEADDSVAAFAEGAASLPLVGSVPQFVAEQVAESPRFSEDTRAAAQGYAERSEAREEVNPIAHGAGEVVSDLALLTASGGTSLATAGGRLAARAAGGAAAEGLAARAAASALRLGTEGAIEGAILGTRDAVSEVALGDAPLTGERLAQHVGMGALLGFGGGAALGGAGRAFADGGERAARALRTRAERSIPSLQASIPDALESFAQGEAFRALRPVKKYTDRAMRRAGGPEGVGEVLLRRNIVNPRATLDTMADDIGRHLTETGDTIGSVVRRADELGAQIDGAGLRSEVGELVGKLRGSNFGSGNRLGARLEREMEPLLARLDAGEMTVEDLWLARRELDDIAYRGSNAMNPNPLNAELQRVRATIEDTVDSTIERAGADVGEELAASYRAAKKDYSALALSRDAVQDRLSRESANRSFSLTDYIGAGAAGALTAGSAGGPAGLAVTFIGGRLHKWWRENNRQLLAGTADRVSTMMRAQRGATSIASQTDAAVGRYLKRLQGGAARLKKAPRSAARVARITSLEAFETRAEAVQRFQREPAEAVERLGSHTATLATAAPETTAAVHQTAIRGAQFLDARLPPQARPRSGVMAHMLPPQVVPDTERMKWMRYAEAVEDPSSVLEDLEAGTLTPEGVEALREVYPAMYRELTRQVMEQIADLDEPPPYEERVEMSLLLGMPLDPSMEPAFVTAMQATYIQQEPQTPPSSAQARPVPNLAGHSLSQTQRLDARRSAQSNR